jgi:hypothetical protein
VKLLDKFYAWRARRRHAAHRRWLKRNRVFIPTRRIEPGCVVRNIREHNSWR